MSNYKVYELKATLLGADGVGKSAFTVNFVRGIFVEKYDPNIEDTYRMQVEVNKKNVMVETADTVDWLRPDNQFTQMQSLMARTSDIFLICFSLVDRETFEKVPRYYEKVLELRDTPAQFYLVGTKADLEDQRVVGKEEAEQMAIRIGGARYFEASAKRHGVPTSPSDIMVALTKDFLGQKERDMLSAKSKEVRSENRKCIVS